MNTLPRLLTALSLLAFAGCAAPIKVGADYDPFTSFDSYSSYSWLPEPEGALKQDEVRNELLTERVQSAAEASLAAKGWSKAEGEPSAWVIYHALVKRRLDIRTVSTNYGYGYNNSTHTWTQEYDEGTLVIDIIDAKDKRLVWRGFAQGRVDLFAEPEEKVERINEAVKAILAQYPPEKKKAN